jgi:hypothetical protein
MFGGGTDVRNYSRFLSNAIQALNEAQIAVYPIGVANPADSPTGSGLAVSTRGTNPNSKANDSGLRGSGIDTMNLVAGATGGKAHYALTNTAGAVEEVMEDAVVTYQIGFTPSERDLDGKYHELRVEVRKPKGEGSLDVRHRKGYLAKEAKPLGGDELRAQLRHAIASPLDVTAVGLAAQPVAVAAGQPRQFVLRVDARDLQIDVNRGAHITLATSYPGSSLVGSASDLDLKFATEARLRDVLTNGYLGRVVVEHPEATQVRFAVQDRATGRTGTLTIDLPSEIARQAD